MERRTATRNNGGPAPSADIYKQLIDNDMVKELDDIEAISQQISQHAEVLYNSWKSNNNNNNNNSNGGLSQQQQQQHEAGLGSPAPHLRQSSELSGGVSNSTGPFYRGAQPAGQSSRGSPRHNGLHHHRSQADSSAYGSLDRLTSHPQQRYQAGAGYSSNSLDRQLPHQHRSWEQQQTPYPGQDPLSRAGSSITQISSHQPSAVHSDVGPLELLASPNLSGNLEELVTSFVSTDRAKQAARNTISSTIMRRLGGGSPTASNGSASPVRSPSPTPSSYKAASPLRSPMLASSLLSDGGSGSPRASITSMFPSETAIPISGSLALSPPSPIPIIPFTSNDSIHAPMQSIFSPNSSHNSSSGGQGASPHHNRPVAVIRPKVIRDEPDSISIPVKIMSSSPTSHGSLTTSPSASEGLKSPLALQAVSGRSSPFQFPLSLKPATSLLGDINEPMPNLFDEFGTIRDPDANLLAVRRRFEEAKQRMALSLPAREGGLRPNSLLSRNASLFDTPGWADDPSSFLLEQLRRRKLRRMETPPAAPHPELTPTQRQHIIERSAAANSGLATGAGTGAGGGGAGGGVQVPIRRLLPGGSVAERVLLFENSPSIFGLEPSQSVRAIPQRREPTVTGTALTPWRSQLHEQHNKMQQEGKTERIVPISRLEAAPLLQPQFRQEISTITPAATSHTAAPTEKISSRQTITTAAGGASSTGGTNAAAAPFILGPVPARVRPAPASTTFRPPSLHLPGKEEIPKFYFPNGNPTGKPGQETLVKKLTEAFAKYKNNAVKLDELGQVLKGCSVPLYWKSIVWAACGVTGDNLQLTTLTRTWRRLTAGSHDEAAQFVSLMTGGTRSHLVPEDLVPLIQDVVDTHPGLLFLKEATEFHSRYVHTVIARIFYTVNRSWSGRISVSELRRSSFLSTLRLLQEEDDINQVTDFFSYEHFYVIYCKFWELDKDHDLFIDREDLARHNDHALSTRMIERIFSGAVTRGAAQKEGRMSYTEFVWFLLSEEDKRDPTAIEYWFRCMDLDGDGILSLYELEYFYEEQLQRMEQLGIETLPFDDCICQMLDMIRPATPNMITLRDLKRCKMTPIFFDTFFNLEKYLDHEQRDPFATQRETDEDGNEMSDWDRFAAEEYELLVAEEGNTDHMEDMNFEEGSGGEMQIDDTEGDKGTNNT